MLDRYTTILLKFPIRQLNCRSIESLGAKIYTKQSSSVKIDQTAVYYSNTYKDTCSQAQTYPNIQLIQIFDFSSLSSNIECPHS